MLNFDELMAQVEVDSDINRMNLETEINRTMNLMSKYLRLNYQYKSAMIKGETKLAQLALERRDFYNGEADAAAYKAEPWNGIVKNMDHLNKLLDADVKICEYRAKVDNAKLLMDICEEMIISLRYRNNHINSILEIRKFEAGA